MDGKQRLTTIRDYVNDKFALYKTIKPIEIDGEIYEVAGKKFSQLEEEVQDLILKCGLVIYSCPKNNITSKEEKEIFRRLNNGKQLTNAQMNSVYLDEDLGRRIFDILTDSVEYTSIEELKKAKKRGRPSKSETEDKQQEVEAAEVAPEYITVENEVNFWGDVAVVGGSAIKNGEDRNLVLQCAMLISGYEGGFKDTDIKGYLQSIELDDEDEDSIRNQELIEEREAVYGKLQNAIKTLTEGILERRGLHKKGKKIIPEQNLKKVSIAPIINGMHLAIEQGKEDLYINRLIKFFDEYAENEEYADYVGSGTADINRVAGRRDYFKKMVEQEATDEERAEVEKVQAERQARADQIAEVKIQEAERQAEAERLSKEEKKKSKTPKTSGRGRSKKEDKPEEKAEVTEVSESEVSGIETPETKEEKPAKPKRNRSKQKAKKEKTEVAEEAAEGQSEVAEVTKEDQSEAAEVQTAEGQTEQGEATETTEVQDENLEEQAQKLNSKKA